MVIKNSPERFTDVTGEMSLKRFPTRRKFLNYCFSGSLLSLTGSLAKDRSAQAATVPLWPDAARPMTGLPPDLKGRTSWAVILCRFNDLPPLTTPLSEFTDFIAGAGKGGVFDYWKDVSYGAIDLSGSKVFGWYTMNYSFFKDGTKNRATWIDEAIRLAKENGVDLSPFFGVIAVVNASVDDSATVKNLALGISGAWGQNNWRWCKKCQCLAFAGNAAGSCPAGGTHDHSSSSDYNLAIAMPSFSGQNNWRWCKKCAGLAYAGFGPGPCPSGGTHDHSASADYRLGFGKVGYPGQNNWKWCKKCQVLAFAGKDPGTCAAGGTHDQASSYDYTLVSPTARPFGYLSHFDVAFTAHEMGHCYGLSHAHCAGKPEDYCDPWDIMGAGYSYKDSATRFGPVGPGPDAPHLYKLGWMPESRIFTWTPRRVTLGDTIPLAALNRPDVKGYLMARLVTADRMITVEFRQRTRWDRGLPGNAVVIHELRGDPATARPLLLGDYQAGQRWVDFDKGLSVTIKSLDSASATATITI
jgi:hypothetical protein